MKRPVYELGNPAQAKAVYDYQLAYRPYRAFTRSAYRLLHEIMQPDISYDEGAHEQLAKLDTEDVPMLLTLNHLSDLHDQWTAAAIAHEILPKKVGDIRVIAKDGFYNKKLLTKLGVPTPLQAPLQPIVTGFINQMGTVPAARKKDHAESSLSCTNELLFDTINEFIQTGHPVGIYPEGTHNYSHAELNLPLQRGIGEIALRSLQPGNIPASIVPIGVSYGRDYQQIDMDNAKPNRIRHASVYIGKIATVEHGMSAEDITSLTAAHLQAATTHAFEYYDQRITT
ncbi:hypothetical protein GII36_02210 [Candidatus Mycosynbacter amalyticus]|uniref:Phospholipid/glycerol acyltransferase domain-containing protein n=1 Tax=Candidatus Mycosynbacter amalyticus TaxID=2665156 RepID=A0A857MND7_9BACT|nr:1-acyl-sn-glycerol-3-phosphate acyltransferase [Candidatus Mycosynbacter amalyticus]QHN42661.1 hypothetical protein GII36_02210 [Candidatus Mycosynbacter amalyticus]